MNLTKMVDSVSSAKSTSKSPKVEKQKLLQPLATRLQRLVGPSLLVVIFPQFLEVDHLFLNLQQPL